MSHMLIVPPIEPEARCILSGDHATEYTAATCLSQLSKDLPLIAFNTHTELLSIAPVPETIRVLSGDHATEYTRPLYPSYAISVVPMRGALGLLAYSLSAANAGTNRDL